MRGAQGTAPEGRKSRSYAPPELRIARCHELPRLAPGSPRGLPSVAPPGLSGGQPLSFWRGACKQASAEHNGKPERTRNAAMEVIVQARPEDMARAAAREVAQVLNA